MSGRFNLLHLYALLALLRCLVAFAPGYVHPDEWFQSGEVLFGDLLAIPTVRTWEFDPGYPCRSMASIRLFGLLSASLSSSFLQPSFSSRSIFLVQRVTFLLLSFSVDFSLLVILRPWTQTARVAALCMFASSGALLSLGVRPFSNNVEASTLAVSLAVERSLLRDQRHWTSLSLCLGALFALGFFARFTFVLFAIPVGISFLRTARRRSSGSLFAYVRCVGPAVTSFLVLSILHVAYDTIYFRSRTTEERRSIGSAFMPVIVPLNAALYNFDRTNLAGHGLHPRWLHFAINSPLVFGLIPWTAVLVKVANLVRRSHFELWGRGERINGLMVTTSAFAIATLSLQPHQEPRFLMPLVMPISILATDAIRRLAPGRKRTLCFAACALQSMLVLGAFGYLHQAGTVPALLHLAPFVWEKASAGEDIQLAVWRSFMPPRHLILPPRSLQMASLALNDLQSSDANDVITFLKAQAGQADHVLLLAPLWTVWQHRALLIPFGVTAKSALATFAPHVDTDHLAESIAGWSQGDLSLAESFSYGVWQVTSEATRMGERGIE